MSIRITSAADGLAQAGIDPTTAWADDPTLTDFQRAQLRAMGRSEVQHQYNNVGQYLNTAGQGMGADGRQNQVTPPPMPVNVPDQNGMAADGGQRSPTGGSQSVEGLTDEQLAALIAQYQQTQQPAVQPEMYTYQGAPQSGSQGGLSDTGINTPDYGQVAQRPAYDFSQQQQSQPMAIKQAQVNNFHNAAHSDWKGKQAEMQNGLLDMGQYRQQMGLLG